MVLIALALNVLVTSLGLWHYGRAGHFRLRLLLPFVVTSVPMAFVGGSLEISPELFALLLGIALLLAALRLIGLSRTMAPPREGELRLLWPLGLALGALLDFLAGLIGVGGGIFLSPLLLFLGWADAKRTAAISAAFIWLNSLSGLSAHAIRGSPDWGLLLPLLAVVAVGGGSVTAWVRFASRRSRSNGCWESSCSSPPRSCSSRPSRAKLPPAMRELISVDEAFRLYKEEIAPLPAEEVALEEALHLVLAEDAVSSLDLPPFPQSAMDGYALRSQDTQNATPEQPVKLRLVGEVPARALREIPKIDPGEAVRIFTGGYIPEGADAVLRQEDTRVEDGALVVEESVPPGRDLRRRGEELPAGTPIVQQGERLTAGHIAALAIAGLASIRVHREPCIAVLTTGDEVVPPGRPLEPGQVYDANSALLTSWLREQGYSLIKTEHLPDDLARTTDELARALEGSDLVLTAGGVSVGERDFVMKAAERVGVKPIFWKVRQQPGKPLFFGLYDEKPLVGLPGNPGSVFVCLATHVRRVLDVLEGCAEPGPRFYEGVLREPLERSPARERWVRARWIAEGGQIRLESLPKQRSHMISNLTECTALIRVPAGEGALPPGSPIRWALLRGARRGESFCT